MDMNYIKCGDYYIPDIKLHDTSIHLGRYGMMHKSVPPHSLQFACSERKALRALR